LPGGASPNSSRSRTNGERLLAGADGGSRSAMNIDEIMLQGGANIRRTIGSIP